MWRKHFFDFSLIVSHNVVHGFGGNLGIHSVGVSIQVQFQKLIFIVILV